MSAQARSQAEQAAAFLGLALDPGHLNGVAANLDLLRQHAARLLAVALPADLDAAPVFDAGFPPDHMDRDA